MTQTVKKTILDLWDFEVPFRRIARACVVMLLLMACVDRFDFSAGDVLGARGAVLLCQRDYVSSRKIGRSV